MLTGPKGMIMKVAPSQERSHPSTGTWAHEKAPPGRDGALQEENNIVSHYQENAILAQPSHRKKPQPEPGLVAKHPQQAILARPGAHEYAHFT